MTSPTPSSLIFSLRRMYHEKICSTILGARPGSNVLSVADSGSRTSVALAAGMAANMNLPLCTNPPAGQDAGAKFTRYTGEFLDQSFALLRHLRPGDWVFSVSQAAAGITAFDQYAHLRDLAAVLQQYPSLRAALGGDYFITPDIIVSREPVSDTEINAAAHVVDPSEHVARLTPLRESNAMHGLPSRILHASISCKWSIRSDRGQNTRTEALNLIRNRKGRTPHIVAVTLEPLPSRIASIALGTGDVDCVYHAALYELQASAQPYGDATELLSNLVEGRRLRDISDLPFDLSV